MFLDSGATLLYQRNPLSPTVAFGVWITKGSRDEGPAQRGYSHLLEHMVFRGTGRRTALQIAQELESIGGQWDAYTSKESTCFHGKVLEEHFEKFADVLADIVLHPSLSASDLDTESRVVREEIKSVKDSPEESTYELFFQTLFPEHQLGYPVTGKARDIAACTRRRLVDFHHRTYTAGNTILGFVGNLPLKKVVSLLEERFGFRNGNYRNPPGRGFPPGGRVRSIRRPDWYQSHVCVGTRTVSASSPERYTLMLLSNIIGGGVSSRLFQSLRENRGLVYSVFSHTSFWKGTGTLSSFFSVDPRNLPRALEILRGELEKLGRGEVRAEELEYARAQLKGGVVFGIESVESRLFRLFYNEFYHGRYRTLPAVLRNIENVKLKDIAEAARKYLAEEKQTYVTCGPLPLRGLV